MSVISYDLGTGGLKASLVNAAGEIQNAVFVPYETYYSSEDFQEQRPDDWWNAIIESTRKLLDGCDSSTVTALAISGHSLGVVPIGKDGTLLREKTPIWSDKRATEEAEEYFEKISHRDWYMKTGGGFPPACYSIFKIMWYRNNEPEMFANTAKFIGTKDYCNYRLTGVLVTDPSYASGSGAFDLHKWSYDDTLIAPSCLSREIFPDIIPSDSIVGIVTKEAAEATGLPAGTKVMAGGVDNSCMALGAKGIKEGRVYTSLGSSAWIAKVSSEPILDFRYKPYVFAHLIPGMYCSATCIFSAGTSLEWVRKNLAGGIDYDTLNSLAAQSPCGASGILFNPSLAGGSMIEPTPEMTGGFYGLKLGHTQADILRSAMEGIAMNLKVALDILNSYCGKAERMLMVGGGAKSPLWMQIFADVYAIEIEKTCIDQEAATLGAAALALKGSGQWSDYSTIDRLHHIEARYTPQSTETYAPLVEKFKRLTELIAAAKSLQH